MQKDNGSNNSRRRVLKSIGVASSFTALSGLSVGSGSAKPGKSIQTENGQGLNVVDATLNTGSAIHTLNTASTVEIRVENLINYMERKSGLKPESSSEIYINVQTDNSEANQFDPRISVIPFGVDTSQSQKRNSTNGAGFLFVFTVKEEGTRVPVGLYGLTSKEINSGEYIRREFGLKDESPHQYSNEVIADSQLSTPGGVTTMDTIPCAACQVLVDTVCGKVIGGIGGRYVCVAACSAVFGANFIAIFGCAAICSALIQAATAVGCTTVDKQICIYAQNHSPVDFGC
ncbi:halocin C8-like domain-containing protein [Haladaptatus paucihalophilus]|uniref:Halocin C8-like bacteriocin domain-containing protein n=1 Tax=Haladaptatus paucihalophilus DX253 TaxID=797209 RepID=A0A1M7C1A1_HALPU|nr:halocin C8-like domain-containing protein [Haladaptatus paucihalophilus]SHL60967.1 halocin C8-like bacteriocin domain-containing protein [Haladaptatus paucihalophilus DX253]